MSVQRKGKFLFKILLIGDSQVGKTSIIQRYCDGMFKDSNISTIGCDFKTKEVPMEDCTVRVEIWDTAGQEKFKSMTKNMFRGVDGFILTYDITSEQTFKSVSQWISDIKSNAKETSKITLVGNKSDLTNERAVQVDQGNKISKQYNIPFFETSCKDNINVNEVFNRTVKDIYLLKKTDLSLNEAAEKNKLGAPAQTGQKKKDCCSK